MSELDGKRFQAFLDNTGYGYITEATTPPTACFYKKAPRKGVARRPAVASFPTIPGVAGCEEIAFSSLSAFNRCAGLTANPRNWRLT